MPKPKSIKATPALKKRAGDIARTLRETYPDADCELDYTTPLELAVATILSAQCTDKRVNLVTPDLFRSYRSLEDYANAEASELEEAIRTTGFFKNKTKNIMGFAAGVLSEFGGDIPDTIDDLVRLPGVGRKTANVILINAFRRPGIVVDTHCKRLANRLGLTKSDNPDMIEFDLKALLPEEAWSAFSHGMVFHGRRRCYARKPDCANCPLNRRCPARKALAKQAKE